MILIRGDKGKASFGFIGNVSLRDNPRDLHDPVDFTHFQKCVEKLSIWLILVNVTGLPVTPPCVFPLLRPRFGRQKSVWSLRSSSAAQELMLSVDITNLSVSLSLCRY